MHIVVFGEGENARQLAQTLCVDHDVVVIGGENPESLARLERLDVRILRGMGADPAVLAQAELRLDSTFIACHSSDERNIIACLAAKRLGGSTTYCFVSQESYYRSLTGTEGSNVLDIDRVIWPQHMLAEAIARIVLIPDATSVDIFAGGDVWLLEYRLQNGSRLCRPVTKLDLPRGVLAVSVKREGELHVPSGATVFQPDDRVAFMGRRIGMQKMREQYFDASADRIRDVTIIGGGAVGATLARRLERDREIKLKMIEYSADRCEVLAAELPRTLVLHGDGTDLELLRSEEIDRSHVLVSVTDNDERNLLTSLIAKQMGIPKIVTRVGRPENVRLFEHVGIDVPLNPRKTAVDTVLNAFQSSNVQRLASLHGDQGQVLELEVRKDFEPKRIRELPRLADWILVAITRRAHAVVPNGDNEIHAGDKLLIFCTRTAADAVKALF